MSVLAPPAMDPGDDEPSRRTKAGRPSRAKRPKMRNGFRQRSDGSWEYYIYVPDPTKKTGRRPKWRTHRGTLEEAKQQKVLEQAKALGEEPPVTTRTVGEQWRVWLDGPTRMRCGRREQQSRADVGRLHVLPTLGDVEVAKVSPEQIQTLLAQLLDGTAAVPSDGSFERHPLSPTTVHGVWSRMRTFYRHAGRSLRFESPMADGAVVPPKPEVYEGEYWTIEHSSVALRSMQGSRIYWPARLANQTGMRASEIAALSAEHIDIDGRTVEVEWNLERMKSPINIKTPKSKTSRRVLPISVALAEDLRPLVASALAGPGTPDLRGAQIHLLFPKKDGSPRASYWMTTHFNKWQLRNEALLGLPRIRFHDLRDSYAIHLLEKGVDIFVVSRLLGHSSVQVTEQRYVRFTQRMAARAVSIPTRPFDPKDLPG